MVSEARSAWVSRRVFMTASAAGIGLASTLFPDGVEAQNATERPGGPPPPASSTDVPALIRALKPMTAGIAPITDAERLQRMEKAQGLMRQERISAVLLEGGSSLYYFTGVRWGLTERPFVAVMPANGAVAWVCPAFEEARARELIHFGTDVRTWEEDDSPYQRIAEVLKDRGVTAGRVGIEERLRFFVYDGLRRQAPSLEFVSADPVSAGCRMFKSPAELAIMQRANEITLAAYKAALSTLEEGMTLQDFRRNLFAAYSALGAPEAAVLASFGRYTAFPHGSTTPQKLREGDVVMVDDGCSVEGYQSDITRTVVFGKPTPHQIDVWNLEKRAQAAAFAAAKPGVTCEAIDSAARKVITDAGYGPGYKVPGLPHRTGHGIGIDGHEWTYLVRGNKMRLQPGMCFSDEPTITNYAEFGVRLEDCFHVTEGGAKFFTEPSQSLEHPFG
jgi:Xaa-Pro dipeptidase